MARVSDADRMRHMLDFARKARDFSQQRTREDLETDELYALAMSRLLEILGEAASSVSKEGQSHHSDIPWAQIVGLRNRLIHGYDTIDPDIVWQILTQDLPTLIESLERILASEASS